MHIFQAIRPRWKWLIFATIFVSAVGTGIAFNISSPVSRPADLATDRSKRGVVARGRIEPAKRVRTVQGPTGSVIQKLFVKEGDTVAAGTVLAEIDTRASLLAQVAVEEKRLDEAEQQHKQAVAPAKPADIEAQKANIQRLRVEHERLQLEFDRSSSLAARDIVAVEKLDSRRAAMRQASHALEQAEWTLRSLLEPRSVDVAVAEARVETQKNVLARARAELDRTQIRAPVDGTILTIMVREGEALGTEGLLQIADLGRLIVIAEIDEFDIARVALDQPATITGPSLPQPVRGTVSRISNAVFKQKRPTSDVLIGRDARIIEIEITPSSPLPPVIWGEVTVSIASTP